MVIVEGLRKILKKENLAKDEMKDVMNQIMEGRATDAQIAGFLIALRSKGESVEEITGAAEVMREKSIKIKSNKDIVIDTCGTGGDSSGTFNISTVSAFVVAAADVAVAKHGNRSVSSKSGSADVLESLGININITPEQAEQALNEVGIAFLFAVNYHKSMKYAIGPRKELGVRTIFNVLGPLTNPATANIQLMGVYSKELTTPVAKVLKNLGLKRAMVVHGEDGLDEITVTGKTFVTELKDNHITEYEINAGVILNKRTLEEIKGGDAKDNAKITLDILSNKADIPKKEVVLMNSGAALYLAGKTSNLKKGMDLAEEIIDSGKALEKLNQYIKFTNNLR